MRAGIVHFFFADEAEKRAKVQQIFQLCKILVKKMSYACIKSVFRQNRKFAGLEWGPANFEVWG